MGTFYYAFGAVDICSNESCIVCIDCGDIFARFVLDQSQLFAHSHLIYSCEIQMAGQMASIRSIHMFHIFKCVGQFLATTRKSNSIEPRVWHPWIRIRKISNWFKFSRPTAWHCSMNTGLVYDFGFIASFIQSHDFLNGMAWHCADRDKATSDIWE